MGIVATSESFSVDDIAKKFLPHVAPLLLDSDKSIRDQTFSTIESLLKIVRKHSSTMTSPVDSQPNQNGTPVLSGEAVKEADGWTSWAISAVSNSARSSIMNTSSAPKPASIMSTTSIPPVLNEPQSLGPSKTKPRDLISPKSSSEHSPGGWSTENWGGDFEDSKIDQAPRFSADSRNPPNSAAHNKPVKQGWGFENATVPSKVPAFPSTSTTDLNDGWGLGSEEGNAWGDETTWDDAPIASVAKSEKEIEREKRQKEREERRRLKG